MTLEITSVQSASYNSNGVVEFTVTCGSVTDVVTKIFNRPKDQANDNLLQAWLDDGNTIGAYVEPDSPAEIPDLIGHNRREERYNEFKVTLDTMNNLWYDSLSQSDKDTLSAWRTAWLDYPTNISADKPVRPSIFPNT